MGKGERGVLAQRDRGNTGDMGLGLLVTAPSATHMSLCPTPKPHSNAHPRVLSVSRPCVPSMPHSCVPSLIHHSPTPVSHLCVPWSYLCPRSVFPPCPTCMSCLCVPLLSHLCPLHGPIWLSPSCVPQVSHLSVLFMTPCVPPSLPSPTHVSHSCVPSLASLGPTSVSPYPTRVSRSCVPPVFFVFVSSPVPPRAPPYVPPMRPTPVVSLGVPPCLPRFHP